MLEIEQLIQREVHGPIATGILETAALIEAGIPIQPVLTMVYGNQGELSLLAQDVKESICLKKGWSAVDVKLNPEKSMAGFSETLTQLENAIPLNASFDRTTPQDIISSAVQEVKTCLTLEDQSKLEAGELKYQFELLRAICIGKFFQEFQKKGQNMALFINGMNEQVPWFKHFANYVCAPLLAANAGPRAQKGGGLVIAGSTQHGVINFTLPRGINFEHKRIGNEDRKLWYNNIS
jgi:hypothetical protein